MTRNRDNPDDAAPEGNSGNGGASEPPGVRMLRRVWRLDDGKQAREEPPPSVSSDIYHVPARQQEIPRRHHGRAQPPR